MNRNKITLKLHTIETVNKRFTSSSFSPWWEWDFSHISPAHPTFSPRTGWTAGFYLRNTLTNTHYLLTQNRVNRRILPEEHINKHTLPSQPIQGEPQGFTWLTHTLPSHPIQGELQGFTWLTHTLPSHPIQGELQGFTRDTLTNTTFSPRFYLRVTHTNYFLTQCTVNPRVLPETH